jgi:hypothetical protein
LPPWQFWEQQEAGLEQVSPRVVQLLVPEGAGRVVQAFDSPWAGVPSPQIPVQHCAFIVQAEAVATHIVWAQTPASPGVPSSTQLCVQHWLGYFVSQASPTSAQKSAVVHFPPEQSPEQQGVVPQVAPSSRHEVEPLAGQALPEQVPTQQVFPPLQSPLGGTHDWGTLQNPPVQVASTLQQVSPAPQAESVWMQAAGTWQVPAMHCSPAVQQASPPVEQEPPLSTQVATQKPTSQMSVATQQGGEPSQASPRTTQVAVWTGSLFFLHAPRARAATASESQRRVVRVMGAPSRISTLP